MRYLTLGEALVIAEVVTGADAILLAKACQLDLLDSALHAPQAGSGDQDLYPDFADKAAVLVVRLAKNHPLPDGNKRLAWQALTMFCALNGHSLVATTDDVVEFMFAVAAGATDETDAASWIAQRYTLNDGVAEVPVACGSWNSSIMLSGARRSWTGSAMRSR